MFDHAENSLTETRRIVCRDITEEELRTGLLSNVAPGHADTHCRVTSRLQAPPLIALFQDQVQIAKLIGGYRARSIHHQILTSAVFGKSNDIANVRGVRDQHQ
jgi:hypothetical protein